MKKILVLIVVLAMAAVVAGCSCPRADSSGVITISMTNCVLAAQDIICNPPPDVTAGANTVIDVLKPLANTYIPGTAEFNAYVTAENILGVGCATMTGLNGLIVYLQSDQAKNLMAKAGPLRGVGADPAQPFINWRSQGK